MKGRWKAFLGKRTVAFLLSVLLLGTSLPIGAIVSLAAQPRLGTVSAISGAEDKDAVQISNPSGNQVVVTYENPIELVWAPKDTNIGRNADGWWAGIRVDAPKNDNIDLKNAQYQSKPGNTAWTEATEVKSFWKYKDSNDEAEIQYITLWMFIESADALKTATSDLIRTWRFDWNNDGAYEQMVQLRINPTKVILKDTDGKQVYPNAKVSVSMDSTEEKAEYATRVMTITVPQSISPTVFSGVRIEGLKATDKGGKVIGGYCCDLLNLETTDDANDVIDFSNANLEGNYSESSKRISIDALNTILGNQDYWHLADGEYTVKIRFIEPKVYTDFTVTVKDTNLAPINVKGFTVDQTAPAANDVTISYSEPNSGWKDDIGYYNGNGATVTLSAKDIITGIKAFNVTTVSQAVSSDMAADIPEKFTISAENQTVLGLQAVTFKSEGDSATATFTVPANFRGYFICEAVDAAGNARVNKADNRVIVVDNTAPEVNVTFDPAESDFDKDGVEVYNTSRTMTITVKDPNFCPSSKSISLSNFRVENMTSGAPGSFEFVRDGVVQSTVNKGSLNSELQNAENWMYDAGTQTWSVQIRVVGDAIYSNFKVTATDLSGNKNTADATGFIYDTCAPTAPQVTYTESVGATILHAMSFGKAKNADFIVKKESVRVSLTAKDGMSGVQKFIVTVNEDGIPAATSVELPEDIDTEKPGIQFEIDKNSAKELAGFKDVSFTQGEKEKADTFTATFTIPAQFRKALSYEAVDYAGNTSTADGKTVVVDTLAPNLTVTYTGADEQSAVTFFAKDRTETNAVDAASTQNAYIANGKVWATLTFTDENLDLIAPREKAIIEISKDGGAFSALDSKAIEWSALEEIDQHVLQQTATVKLEEDGDYKIRATYTDASENVTTVTSGELTVDTTAPEVTVTFDPATSEFKKGDTEVYASERTMTITVTDRNFRVEDMKLEGLIASDLLGEHNGWGRCDVVRADGTLREGIAPAALQNAIKNLDFWQTSEENSDTKTFTVHFKELVYSEFEVIATDLAGNVTEAKKAGFIVDKTAPDRLSVQYSAPKGLIGVITKSILNIDTNFSIYTTPVTVTLGAEDSTSGIEKFIVTAKPEGSAAATNVKLPADIDPEAAGIQFEICANSKDDKATFGSFKNVSLKQNEENAKEFTASFTVPAQYRGGFTFTAVDYAGKKTSFEREIGTKVNPYTVIDTVSPTLSIAYVGEPKSKVVQSTAADTKYIFSSDVEAILTFTDANLDLNEPSKQAIVEVSKDGGAFSALDSKAIKWSALEENDQHVLQQTATVKLAGDGDYRIRVQYKDVAQNTQKLTENSSFASKETQDNQNIYTTNIITVDKTAPEVTVTFDPATSEFKKGDTEVYASERTMTITVTDRNFRVGDMKLEGLTASDLLGDHNGWGRCDVVRADGTVMRAGIAPAALQNVIKVPTYWQTEGNTHTFRVTFHEMIYSDFQVTATDYADNSSEPQSVTGFIVDATKPENVEIGYSASIFQTTLSGITFGTYNPSVQVTLTTKDTTSGVEMFEITVEPNGAPAATDGKLPEDCNQEKLGKQFRIFADSDENKKADFGKFTGISFAAGAEKSADTFTATFSVPAQYRGQFSAVAVDYAENTSEAAANKSYTAVVDSVAPQLAIHYTQDPQNKVNGEGKLFKPNEQVNADSRFIFNSAVKVELTFTDANLDLNEPREQAIVEVSKDGSAFSALDSKAIQWSDLKETDQHVLQQTAIVTLAGDGDYRIRVQYKDAAQNTQKLTENSSFASKETTQDNQNIYTTNIITVDTTAPILRCVFPNESEAKNIFDGRAYYQAGQTVDLEITEHNFAMMVGNGGLHVDIQAENSQGDRLTDIETELTNFLNTVENWKPAQNAQDTYSVQVQFPKDANYTFSIAPKDLANNAAKNNPQTSEFTVDKVAPSVAIRYAQKVADTVIDAITFGYYNAQVEATVTALDDTAGVYRFEYEGLLAEGVSEKNQAVLKNAIGKAQIRQEQNRFIAKFNIPRETLNELNSFNGTVTVSAYDKSERSATLADTERLVVDKIPPTCNVTFTPEVQTVNEISYYDGPLTATIQINEANFYAEDVVIRVNGARVEPTDWTQSGDVWTSTVTLTEEGDYKLTVEYTDRSKNTMTTYESNQKTIDTTLPILYVEHTDPQKGLYESANNAETVGFTLTVTDRNIGAENIAPKLVSVQRVGTAGAYTFTTTDIEVAGPIGEPARDANGNAVYTYRVENLPQDGYYTLSCEVKDYANHTVNTMEVASANGRREVESIPFSVNREGSVFWLEAKHNGATNHNQWDVLLNDAYINQEVEVVLYELNVDRVDTDADKQTVLTLNDGSKAEDIVLNEGQNYEKNTAEGAGGWYKNTYTLRNDNFKNDGYYSLSILTYDRAGNTNINQNEAQGTIRFTVDRTAPVATFNASNKQPIKADAFPLEIKLTEMNLDESSVLVTVRNSNGEESKFTAVELTPNGNVYQRELTAGKYDSVTVYAKDLAGNESTTVIEDLTISTNDLVLFYAGHPVLCWLIVVFVVILTAFVLLMVFMKKRKKEQDA